jgi:hypothetical protein
MLPPLRGALRVAEQQVETKVVCDTSTYDTFVTHFNTNASLLLKGFGQGGSEVLQGNSQSWPFGVLLGLSPPSFSQRSKPLPLLALEL